MSKSRQVEQAERRTLLLSKVDGILLGEERHAGALHVVGTVGASESGG